MTKDTYFPDPVFQVSRWFRWTYGIILGVLLNFLLDVVFSLFYTNYLLFQPIGKYGLSILLTYGVFELIFYINTQLGKKLSWEEHPIIRLSIQFLLDTLVAVILVSAIRWIWLILFADNYYIFLLDEMIRGLFIAAVMLAFAILELSFYLQTKWRFSLAELERFKKENTEIRLDSLRNQLNPHFLFNSLNTLSSLIYENQDKAGLFVRELSDVYRYILDNREKTLVSLEEELEFSDSYIHLLQLRFDSNLIIKKSKIPKLEGIKIAPLTVQLLIENAIKHNIISKKQPLHIEVYQENNFLVVKNNVQLKRQQAYSSGLGLKNIQSRYAYLSKDEVFISNNNKEFMVKVPLI